MERQIPVMLAVGKKADRPPARDFGRLMYLAYDEKPPRLYYSDGNNWTMEFRFAGGK